MTESKVEKFRDADHAVMALRTRFGVDVSKDIFKINRKKKILFITVAAVGDKFKDIRIFNPEYSVHWWEPTTEFLHTLWRMAKSGACRGNLIRAFKVAYLEIEKHEFTDEFRKQMSQK